MIKVSWVWTSTIINGQILIRNVTKISKHDYFIQILFYVLRWVQIQNTEKSMCILRRYKTIVLIWLGQKPFFGTIEHQRDMLKMYHAFVYNYFVFQDIRSVTFTIHDSTFDGKSIINPHSVDGLKGGQNLHRITVNCNPLPASGMNVYVVHGVGLWVFSFIVY